MEARKSKIIGVALIITLIICVIVFRISLGLSGIFFLILGASLAGITASFLWMFIQHRADRSIDRLVLSISETPERQQLRVEYSFLRKVGGVPTKFQYKDIEVATDDFQALLGRGSSGSVYKGILKDGTRIAVKQIEAVGHGEREFKAEVAAIASAQHVNLVRLLGFTIIPGGSSSFLVYEYVHNGSLDGWIFPQNSVRHGRSITSCLSWHLRYRVAIDVAKALAYLHDDCRSRILHLDVKPDNILLDDNFRAVVTDFGLSKLMGREESRIFTSTVRGTTGYLAPEWLLGNGVSEKSDIYSYGMVLLEMVGGRRNVQLIRDDIGDNSRRKWSYFPKIVAAKLKEGKLMDVVDERIASGECNMGRDFVKEVRMLVYAALWCIQEDPSLRPSMSRVVDMLEGRLNIDEPPETEMVLADLFSIDDQEPSDGVLNIPTLRTDRLPTLRTDRIPTPRTDGVPPSPETGMLLADLFSIQDQEPSDGVLNRPTLRTDRLPTLRTDGVPPSPAGPAYSFTMSVVSVLSGR